MAATSRTALRQQKNTTFSANAYGQRTAQRSQWYSNRVTSTISTVRAGTSNGQREPPCVHQTVGGSRPLYIGRSEGAALAGLDPAYLLSFIHLFRSYR
eukprot:2695845-Pyramimonas_sp.AAC.1